MKIVNISGGLGNQMGGHTHSDGNNFFHNGFEIYDVFPNASVPSAPVKEIMRVTYYIPSYKLDSLLWRNIVDSTYKVIYQKFAM